MAHLQGFLLGLLSARASGLDASQAARRGAFMAISPLTGAVLSRVVEDRETAPAPVAVGVVKVARGGRGGAAVAAVGAGVDPEVSRRFDEVEEKIEKLATRRDVREILKRLPPGGGATP